MSAPPGRRQQQYPPNQGYPQQLQPPSQQYYVQQPQAAHHAVMLDQSGAFYQGHGTSSTGSAYSHHSTSPTPNPSATVDGLQFYQSNYAIPPASSTSGTRHSPIIGNGGHSSTYSTGSTGYGVMSAQPVSWLAALGTGAISADEPPLLEELEINLSHIKGKTIAVLNPLRTIDKHIMDDTDLMGPLLFCLLFGVSLLLSGKVHFGYIYGVALMGWLSIWTILNLMSDGGIDTLRAASVLGYCLLPMVLLSCLSVVVPLQYTRAYYSTY